MNRSCNRGIRTGLASSLCFALLAGQALAVERHKSIEVEAGKPVRVANHIHFRASTCEAISIPKVIIRQKPSKGTVAVIEDVVPLQNTRSERGEQCIGRPMQAAVIRYTPFASAKGNDVLAYDVIYPASCTNCRNYEVSVAIEIEENPLATARAPSRDTTPARAPAPAREAAPARAPTNTARTDVSQRTPAKAPRPQVTARAPAEASRPVVTERIPAEITRSDEAPTSESGPDGSEASTN